LRASRAKPLREGSARRLRAKAPCEGSGRRLRTKISYEDSVRRFRTKIPYKSSRTKARTKAPRTNRVAKRTGLRCSSWSAGDVEQLPLGRRAGPQGRNNVKGPLCQVCKVWQRHWRTVNIETAERTQGTRT